MIDLTDIRFFQAIANAPSLAAAARQLGVSAPAVSQRLTALETRTGVTLVVRGTGSVVLTEEGNLLLRQGAPLLRQADDLLEDIAARQGQLVGPLRVVAPFGYGRLKIAPLLGSFAKDHPDVAPELVLSDHPRSLMGKEGWDVLVNVGRLPDLAATQVLLRRNKRILCAAPAYLERAGYPQIPQDLVNFRCGVVREDAADVSMWEFRSPSGEPTRVRISPAFTSNDGEVIRAWARQGLGIIERSAWSVSSDIACGDLHPVLPEWDLADADVIALLQPGFKRPRKVTAFLDHLKSQLT